MHKGVQFPVNIFTGTGTAAGKLQQDNEPGVIDRQDLRNIYAVIGSIQSLMDAMKELGDSMKQINWHQWAVARF